MTKGGNEITKDEWNAYREVQDSGMYNMFSPEAIRESGLDKETYLVIVTNYSELEEKFEGGSDEEEES